MNTTVSLSYSDEVFHQDYRDLCNIPFGAFSPIAAMNVLLAFAKHLETASEAFFPRSGISHIPDGFQVKNAFGDILLYIQTSELLWSIHFAHQEHKVAMEAQLEKIILA
jgi:hypothetical protein